MSEESFDLSFEEAMEKLEEIVKKLENGTQTLEESLILFQKGIELSKICAKKLNEASGKISILTREIDGSFLEKNFMEDENDK